MSGLRGNSARKPLEDAGGSSPADELDVLREMVCVGESTVRDRYSHLSR
jgi:hypothetical protein